MSEALVPEWCQQEIYSPTTEYGVSFDSMQNIFYINFLMNKITQKYTVTKNFHITLCAVLLLNM